MTFQEDAGGRHLGGLSWSTIGPMLLWEGSFLGVLLGELKSTQEEKSYRKIKFRTAVPAFPLTLKEPVAGRGG